jgi:hypothetical protein
MTTRTPRRTTVALALVAAAAMACSKSSTAADQPTPCVITLGGAQTGNPACSNLTAVWTASNNQTGFGLQGSDASDTLYVAVGFAGVPKVHAYISGVDASPSLTLVNSSTAWSNGPGNGALTLTISSVKPLNSGAGLAGYEVHGTLTATLNADVSDGSIGPVTLNVTF